MTNWKQSEIFQGIVDTVLSVIDDGWKEFVLVCYIDEEQSAFGNSFIVEQGNGLIEKSLDYLPDFDMWFRRLRAELPGLNKELFTRCRLHVSADGKFDASYGYDPLNWPDLFELDWNFPGVEKGN